MLAQEIAFGRLFADNITYNLEGSKNEPKPDRCEWFVTRNLVTGDLAVAGKIMQATAARSRTDTPVYHFSINWHPEEEPLLNKEKAIEAADKVLEKLGLDSHQAIYFWHTDEEHPHMHVVVNRLHEDAEVKKRAWEKWRSKSRLEVATHEVAKELDFLQVPGRHNEMAFEADKEKPAKRDKADEQRAEKLGEKPLLPWKKEKVADVRDAIKGHFYEAKSWGELEARMAEHGYYLKAKGQGLVVTDGEMFAKLSGMGKGVRLKGDKSLEQRFGETWDTYVERTELEPEKEAKERLEDRVARQQDEPVIENDEPFANRASQRGHTSVDMRVSDLIDAHETAIEFDQGRFVQNAANGMSAADAKVRRQQWLLERSKELSKYHDAQFTEMLVSTFDNPEEAREKIEELRREGRVRETTRGRRRKIARWKRILEVLTGKGPKKEKIGRKRGRKVAGYKTAERKRAEALERRIFYRLQKMREAQNRISTRKKELAMAQGAARMAKKDYERQKAIEKAVFKQRREALEEVKPRHIRQADLGWPMKNTLLNLREAYDREKAERAEALSQEREAAPDRTFELEKEQAPDQAKDRDDDVELDPEDD